MEKKRKTIERITFCFCEFCDRFQATVILIRHTQCTKYIVQCTCNKSNIKFYVKKIIYQTLKIVVATTILQLPLHTIQQSMEWYYFEQQQNILSSSYKIEWTHEFNLISRKTRYLCVCRQRRNEHAHSIPRGADTIHT